MTPKHIKNCKIIHFLLGVSTKCYRVRILLFLNWVFISMLESNKLGNNYVFFDFKVQALIRKLLLLFFKSWNHSRGIHSKLLLLSLMNKLQNIKANSLKQSMLSRFLLLLLFSLMLNIVFFLELISGLQSLEKWSEPIVTFFPLPSSFSSPSFPPFFFFFSPFPPNFFAPNLFQCLLCTWHIDTECLGFKGEKNAGSSEQLRETQDSKPHLPMPESIESPGRMQRQPGHRRELLRGGKL